MKIKLTGTYRQVQQNIEAVEQAELEVRRSSNNLSCITSLLNCLVQLSTGMTPEEISMVKAALTPNVHDGQDQGWQESTDAALTFLLRTSLAKAGKENQGATPITLDLAKDTNRIKKHISSVIDRVTKGSRISDDKNKLESASLMDFKMEDEEEEDIAQTLNGVHSTPVGSHYGEQGERLRSARTRSARISSAVSRSVSLPNGEAGSNPRGTVSEKSSPTEEEKEVEKYIRNEDADGDDEKDDDIW